MFLNEFRTISKTVLAKSGEGAAAPLPPLAGATAYYPQHLHYLKLLKLKYVITNFVIVQIMCTAIQNWIIILLLFVNSREYDYTISKTHTQIYIYI